MKESCLQSKCIKYCKTHNILIVNVHGGGWGNKGFPDLLMCINGLFVSAELKVNGNTLSEAQKIWASRIITAGGIHFVATNLDEFVCKLQSIMGGSK